MPEFLVFLDALKGWYCDIWSARQIKIVLQIQIVALFYSPTRNLFSPDLKIDVNTCKKEPQTKWKDKSFNQGLCNNDNSESIMETGIFSPMVDKVIKRFDTGSKTQLSHKQ